MRRAFLTILAAFICSILGYFNYEVNAHSLSASKTEQVKVDDHASHPKTDKKVSSKASEKKK